MIIALTGSNGYIGGHVLHLALAQGHTIRGIDSNPSISKKETDPERSASRSHPNYSFTSADLHNFEATLDALRGCDAVIHLAAVLGGFNDYLVEVHNRYWLRSHSFDYSTGRHY
jgi:nucleoside-diphosphate-sugar epimerase